MKKLAASLFALFLVGGVASACRPGTIPGSPESAFTREDTVAAIDRYFPEWWLNGTAKCIGTRESNLAPYSVNGRYQGWAQLDSRNPGYHASMRQAAGVQGRMASFFDPFVSAQVARIIVDVRASKGLDPWAPWSTAGGCR